MHLANTESKFQQLNSKLDTYCSKVEDISQCVENHEKSIKSLQAEKASISKVQLLEAENKQMKSVYDKALAQAAKERQEQQSIISRQVELLAETNLDLKRVSSDHAGTQERMNVYDIRSRHLFLTIEGLLETKDNDVIGDIVSRFNGDTKATLCGDDFEYAHRVGKLKFKIKDDAQAAKLTPRSIKVKVVKAQARVDILVCWCELKVNENGSMIWINEDHSDTYRRRKTMLRELVKCVNKQEGVPQH